MKHYLIYTVGIIGTNNLYKEFSSNLQPSQVIAKCCKRFGYDWEEIITQERENGDFAIYL